MAGFTAALFLGAIILFFYINDINGLIDARMAQLHEAQPSVFYAITPPLKPQQRFTRKELRSFLESQGYREAANADDILAGDYVWDKSTSPPGLFLFRPEFKGAGHPIERMRVRVSFAESDGDLLVTEIKRTDDQALLEGLESIPKQVGAYFAGRVRTQNSIGLSDMPVSMRYALMAIEDPKFLEHFGISVRGIFRALLKNIESRRASQGGSTITQQLMKNLFFTRQKSLSRKAKEAIFAFITEMRYSKEQILEAYLNEVYLGQWSTHEIHGVSEGARYYFNTPATELTLPQSALLAAMVQAPNDYDPWRFPARAIKRRNLVLKKMAENDFILKDEYDDAVKEPLGVVGEERQLDDVEYFTDLVMDRLPPDVIQRLSNDHLTIYVTLNPDLQAIASRSLSETIDNLTKSNRALEKKTKQGLKLQGAIIAIDPQNCAVLALQGGRHYRQTQFNRVLQGHRQPGSLFKPFVALSALMAKTAEGPITPITQFDDSPLEWKYEKQNWKPKNYDGKFRGMVTLQQALEDSINIPMARALQRMGVPALVETLKKVGITSPLPEFPSLALGSAEVTPMELAEAYTTMANLGKSCTLRPYYQVYDGNRNLVQETPLVQEERLPPQPIYQTVNMMKAAFVRGTARSAQWAGFNTSNFAGKTGTTNDAKDAWFVGFSPQLLVLVWVGYDEKEKVGLTGAAAALPAWINFMKSAGPYRTDADFKAPPGLMKCEVDFQKVGGENPAAPEKIIEYFQPGTEPANTPCQATE
jgi:penicillin-binding protein 1B